MNVPRAKASLPKLELSQSYIFLVSKPVVNLGRFFLICNERNVLFVNHVMKYLGIIFGSKGTWRMNDVIDSKVCRTCVKGLAPT